MQGSLGTGHVRLVDAGRALTDGEGLNPVSTAAWRSMELDEGQGRWVPAERTLDRGVTSDSGRRPPMRRSWQRID